MHSSYSLFIKRGRINFFGNIDEKVINSVCEEGYNFQKKLIGMHEDRDMKIQRNENV